MGRPPCCDKANVKRGPWTPEEDAKILAYVATYGIGNWTLVPQKAGLNRCGKSCRLRWTNYLRPDLKHDNFTPDEEECILHLHKTIGSRWSLIARRLPGRTDNDVKNYWNTKLKKKLSKMGIDPVTHKPFSQLLVEYEKISGSTNQNPFLHQNPICKPENINGDQVQMIAHFRNDAIGVTRSGCDEARIAPCECFMCSDYILGDERLMVLENNESVHLQEEGLVTHDHFTPTNENRDDYYLQESKISCLGNMASSSSSSSESFVEAILAHDSEMRLQFPEMLDENYNY